jgi:hypothetical protein
LAGILLVLLGCFLPWGVIGYGRNGEVLLPLSALQGIFVPAIGIVNLFIFTAFLLAPLFTYYLLVEKASKGAYSVLTVGGACMMFFMIVSSVYYLSIVNVGVLVIIGGCSLIVLAGLFSFLCAKSISRGAASTDKAENLDLSLRQPYSAE